MLYSLEVVGRNKVGILKQVSIFLYVYEFIANDDVITTAKVTSVEAKTGKLLLCSTGHM